MKFIALSLGMAIAIEWYIYESSLNAFNAFETFSIYGIGHLICFLIFFLFNLKDFKNAFCPYEDKIGLLLTCLVQAILVFYSQMFLIDFVDDDYNMLPFKFIFYIFFLILPPFAFSKKRLNSILSISAFTIAVAGFLLLVAKPEVLVQLYESKSPYFTYFYVDILFCVISAVYWWFFLFLLKKDSFKYPIKWQITGVLFLIGIFNFVADILSGLLVLSWDEFTIQTISSVVVLDFFIFYYLIITYRNIQAHFKINNRAVYLLLCISIVYAIHEMIANCLSKGEAIGCVLVILSVMLLTNEFNINELYLKIRKVDANYYIRGSFVFIMSFLLLLGLYYYLPFLGVLTSELIDIDVLFYLPAFRFRLKVDPIYVFLICSILITLCYYLKVKKPTFNPVFIKYREKVLLLIINLIISSAITNLILIIIDIIDPIISHVAGMKAPLIVSNAFVGCLILLFVLTCICNVKDYNLRAMFFTFAVNVPLLENFLFHVSTSFFMRILDTPINTFLFNIPYYTGNLLTGSKVAFILVVFIEIFPIFLSYEFLKRLFYRHVTPYHKAEGKERKKLEDALHELHMGSKKVASQTNIYISDIRTMNAYSLDESTLIVTKGIVEKLTESELAAIIAHELGHGIHKDAAVKLIIRMMNLPIYGLFKILTFPLRIPKNQKDLIITMAYVLFLHFVLLRNFWVLIGVCSLFIMRVILEIPVFVLTRIDEKNSEYAADRYVCETGLGIPLLTALKKLEKEEQEKSAFYNLLSGHPLISQRIGKIEDLLNKDLCALASVQRVL